MRRAFAALYEEYGAWLILVVACGFSTAVGWSFGTRATQEVFVEVYKSQQAAADAQAASMEERIMNLRGMLADKEADNKALTNQIANLGGKTAEATKAVGEALNKATITKPAEEPK